MLLSRQSALTRRTPPHIGLQHVAECRRAMKAVVAFHVNTATRILSRYAGGERGARHRRRLEWPSMGQLPA